MACALRRVDLDGSGQIPFCDAGHQVGIGPDSPAYEDRIDIQDLFVIPASEAQAFEFDRLPRRRAVPNRGAD